MALNIYPVAVDTTPALVPFDGSSTGHNCTVALQNVGDEILYLGTVSDFRAVQDGFPIAVGATFVVPAAINTADDPLYVRTRDGSGTLAIFSVVAAS